MPAAWMRSYLVCHGRGESTGGGFGLAVIKPLIELHGGKVWLKSAVGKGSTFFFSLPIVE